jgi:hypothetical protein
MTAETASAATATTVFSFTTISNEVAEILAMHMRALAPATHGE